MEQPHDGVESVDYRMEIWKPGPCNLTLSLNHQFKELICFLLCEIINVTFINNIILLHYR